MNMHVYIHTHIGFTNIENGIDTFLKYSTLVHTMRNT